VQSDIHVKLFEMPGRGAAAAARPDDTTVTQPDVTVPETVTQKRRVGIFFEKSFLVREATT
jgi:hypothetical protein